MNEHERRQAAKNTLRVLSEHGIPSGDAAVLLAKIAGACAHQAAKDSRQRDRIMTLMNAAAREAMDELEIAEREERTPRQHPRQRAGAGAKVHPSVSTTVERTTVKSLIAKKLE